MISPYPAGIRPSFPRILRDGPLYWGSNSPRLEIHFGYRRTDQREFRADHHRQRFRAHRFLGRVVRPVQELRPHLRGGLGEVSGHRLRQGRHRGAAGTGGLFPDPLHSHPDDLPRARDHLLPARHAAGQRPGRVDRQGEGTGYGPGAQGDRGTAAEPAAGLSLFRLLRH